MSRNAYLVAGFNPFWRYAVCLDNRPDLPAIPFTRKASALAFFDRSSLSLPQARTVLLKRKWFGRVVVLPKEEA